jgi:hypothetical protein
MYPASNGRAEAEQVAVEAEKETGEEIWERQSKTRLDLAWHCWHDMA